MIVRYDKKAWELTIFIEPHEADRSSLLMQLVLEEEWQKGTSVPNLKEDFFRELAVTRERFPVVFDYEYLEFVIRFLEETCVEQKEHGISVDTIEDFMCRVRECCPLRQTIH